ncbi:MAG TPA: hypothetical protein PKD54_08480 [Pirellulaceae bacterium]|nr:hypothetical protein [Pirellulaceae bacterium]
MFQKTATHHLVFVAAEKQQIHRYFSVETGLLVREEQLMEAGKNTELVISEIADYERDSLGTVVARRRVNHLPHGSFEFKIEALESNVLEDDSLFAIPDAVAKLVGRHDRH